LISSACILSYVSTGAGTVVMTPYICNLLIVLRAGSPLL
jgi:hypothetical protein